MLTGVSAGGVVPMIVPVAVLLVGLIIALYADVRTTENVFGAAVLNMPPLMVMEMSSDGCCREAFPVSERGKRHPIVGFAAIFLARFRRAVTRLVVNRDRLGGHVSQGNREVIRNCRARCRFRNGCIAGFGGYGTAMARVIFAESVGGVRT